MTEQSTSTVTVEGHDETEQGLSDVERWCEVARQTLIEEGVTRGHLDLIFVDSGPMADLNRRHLDHEGPTDVLAFPLDGPEALGGIVVSDDSSTPSHLGDVVICPEVARNQAPDHAGDVAAELTLLVVHGVLHVLGHDHALARETELMQSRERLHLQRHGFRHPVVA